VRDRLPDPVIGATLVRVSKDRIGLADVSDAGGRIRRRIRVGMVAAHEGEVSGAYNDIFRGAGDTKRGVVIQFKSP
jgi:hypothetical protein